MDWISSIVGGAIGFAASIGTMTAEKVWDRMGHLRIFYRIRNGREDIDTFGTSRATDGSLVFIVPLVFEMQNTSNTARVVRDVSINLYYQGRFIDKMVQVGQAGNGENTKEYGGEKQSYSFVIDPRSIQKVFGTFMYAPSGRVEEEHNFDEIRIKYYDERNKMCEFHIRYVQNPWKQRNIGGDEDWILLENNMHCKRAITAPVPIEDEVPMTSEKMTYLQMIQEPICRMSTISGIFKGFAATIVAGIAVLTYCEVYIWVLGLSFLPVLLFAFLDIYYLKIERKYRYLYEQVRVNNHAVDFSMKLTRDNKAAKARIYDCILSPSIWLFYPVMLAILVAVFLMKMKGVI